MKSRLLLAPVLIAITSTTLFSQALNFDGTNDYVSINPIAAEMNSLTTFTVEFWVKADKNLQSSVRVGMFAVNDTNVPPADNIFIITMGGMNAQDGKVLIVDNVTGFDFVSNTVIGDNVCHHIAYVRNGSVSSIYIDGTLAGTHTPDYAFDPNHRFSLGHEWDYGSSSDNFEGTLEDVRIWNISRSATDIQTYMGVELVGNETGLIAYYPFNQGNANGNNTGLTTLVDFSANSNHGVLNNFTLTGSVSNWVDACTGSVQANSVEEISGTNLLTFPNPVNGFLQIEAVLNEPEQFRIIDSQGRVVKWILLSTGTTTIDVSDLEAGLYFLVGSTTHATFLKN